MSWLHLHHGIFSMKSCYNLLSRLVTPYTGCQVWIVLFSKIRGKVWHRPRCVRFLGNAILDGIPTRMNLFRRGVIQPAESKDCIVCRNEV
jgi:hypothetical protein